MSDAQSPRLRLLLLEDCPSDAELVLHQLRHSGFDLDWRRVVSEADDLPALDASLDLTLADFKLPGFGAFGALEAAQSSARNVREVLD